MRRVIVSAGLHRSGSTWLYNVLRIAAGDCYATFHDEYDPDNPAKLHVVKVHGWDGELAGRAERVLMTYRDLRDVAASAVLRGLAEPSNVVAYIKRIMDTEWYPWARVADTLVQYEHAMGDPVPQVARILKSARLDADPAEVVNAVAALQPPAEGTDPVTLLHADHFTDARNQRALPKRTAKKIEAEHRDWLRHFRYPTEETG